MKLPISLFATLLLVACQNPQKQSFTQQYATQFELFHAYLDENKIQEAQVLLHSIPADQTSVERSLAQARLYEYIGEIENSIQSYTQLLEGPLGGIALINLTAIYIKQNQAQISLNLFKQHKNLLHTLQLRDYANYNMYLAHVQLKNFSASLLNLNAISSSFLPLHNAYFNLAEKSLEAEERSIAYSALTWYCKGKGQAPPMQTKRLKSLLESLSKQTPDFALSHDCSPGY